MLRPATPSPAAIRPPVRLRGIAPYLLGLAGLLAPTLLAAQTPAPDPPAKIRDNLFLLEEAYNQEPGVIQHIQGVTWNRRLGTWNYSVTDEWPVPDDRHQLSLTLPFADTAAAGGSALGDLLVNYRFQAVGAGGAGRLAVAPRLSLVLPAADYRTGAGRGAIGVQMNLPVSVELGPRFVAHLNGGFTLTPAARSSEGHGRTLFDTNTGAALVWLAHSNANALVEIVQTSVAGIQPDASVQREHTVIVNPGMRFAINVGSGLQIVPGVSVPIQFPARGGRYSFLAYLSLEHRAWSPSPRSAR